MNKDIDLHEALTAIGFEAVEILPGVTAYSEAMPQGKKEVVTVKDANFAGTAKLNKDKFNPDNGHLMVDIFPSGFFRFTASDCLGAGIAILDIDTVKVLIDSLQDGLKKFGEKNG